MARTHTINYAECHSTDCLRCQMSIKQDQKLCCVGLRDTVYPGEKCRFFKEREKGNRNDE